MKKAPQENIPSLRKQMVKVVSNGKITKEYFEILLKLADLGDPNALSDLGHFLNEGYRDSRGKILLRRDQKASTQCYLLAAAQGDTYSMIAVADSLAATGKKDALAEAENLYKLAFKLGDAMGAYNLGCTYHGLGKYTEAVLWFKKCLKAGDPGALIPLAYAELYGTGMRRNVEAAFDKLRRIAKGGKDFCQFDQEEAMLTMAEALRNGWLVQRDYDASISWLRRAAKLGSSAAKGLLADYTSCSENHNHQH
jgi:TPR repeat protein